MEFTNLICHHKLERSFHFKGHQFPVCARRTGVYLGVFTYIVYAYFYFIDYTPSLLLFSVLILLPLVVDGVTQSLGFHESNNTLRFITVLLRGLSIGILI
ncbi:DUF2085 domain-containing protein [Methanobrevibacter acididurans]|jgi:uncharacterized membrane protein|uniref:DUF2085 domain-containing protein n=1 Tax=Methanobrevibacter TaxID=2172 RepID=UPI0038FD0385